MSSCLYVYQDHVGMGSWGSSSEIYQASTAPYNPADEYGETFDPFKGFSRIINHLQDKIEEHKEQLPTSTNTSGPSCENRQYGLS